MIEHPNRKRTPWNSHRSSSLTKQFAQESTPRLRVALFASSASACARTDTHTRTAHAHAHTTHTHKAGSDGPACLLINMPRYRRHRHVATGSYKAETQRRQRPSLRPPNALPACSSAGLSAPVSTHAGLRASMPVFVCRLRCKLANLRGHPYHHYSSLLSALVPVSPRNRNASRAPPALAPRSSFGFLRSDPRALADHSSQQAARRTAAETCAVRRL